jgi:ribosomal protein S18 acetylase RimI-like enzyme
MTGADEANPYEAEIEMLAVLPADQHVGLGRSLMRTALLAAGRDGRSSVILSVSTFSKRAMAMYLDAGFGVHDVRVCWELRRA